MKYYIIAGEASGDLHGANLMKELMRRDPEADIRFWGGDAMMQVGGKMIRHIRDLSYMGIVEVAMHLKTVLGNLKFCKKDILEFQPDAIIYIDYPGFNLKIAHWAKKQGFKNYHYISPQLWAWKKGRIKNMRKDLDKLFYILPFEQDFYARNNFPQAYYVGHPLLDAIKAGQWSNTLDIKSDKPIIALLPGSRRQELKKMLKPMLTLAKKHQEYLFVIAGMSLLGKKFYEPYLSDNVKVVYDQTYALLSESFAAIVCSGTATLEAALFNVPQVVCYKANPITIAVGRVFIGSRIKYISLVNLIADQPIVKELLQNDCNDHNIEKEFRKITTDEGQRTYINQGYALVHNILGNAGASAKVAQLIIEK